MQPRVSGYKFIEHERQGASICQFFDAREAAGLFAKLFAVSLAVAGAFDPKVQIIFACSKIIAPREDPDIQPRRKPSIPITAIKSRRTEFYRHDHRRGRNGKRVGYAQHEMRQEPRIPINTAMDLCGNPHRNFPSLAGMTTKPACVTVQIDSDLSE